MKRISKASATSLCNIVTGSAETCVIDCASDNFNQTVSQSPSVASVLGTWHDHQ
jgi:hypothetical protein